MPSKRVICRRENATAVQSLRAKIVIVALNTKCVKTHYFCAQLPHYFMLH